MAVNYFEQRPTKVGKNYIQAVLDVQSTLHVPPFVTHSAQNALSGPSAGQPVALVRVVHVIRAPRLVASGRLRSNALAAVAVAVEDGVRQQRTDQLRRQTRRTHLPPLPQLLANRSAKPHVLRTLQRAVSSPRALAPTELALTAVAAVREGEEAVDTGADRLGNAAAEDARGVRGSRQGQAEENEREREHGVREDAERRTGVLRAKIGRRGLAN